MAVEGDGLERRDERNLRIYHDLMEAFNRGGVDEVLGYFAEDVEIYDPDLPEPRYRGHEGLREMLGQMMSGSEVTEVRDYELLPAGDRVVALTHTYTRAAGVEIEMRDAHLMTFRDDGKIAYWRLYLDREEALGDAGLAPGRDGGKALDEGAGPASGAAPGP